MATRQKEKKAYNLSLPRRVGYGIGDFGINMFSTVLGSFLTAYYTDSVLLAAVFVGNMMLLTRILDGVSDLVMGAIIDKTYTKWGKARPWMALAIIPFCLSFFLVFNVPSSLGETGTKVYVVLTYIFHTVICSTIANVALSTLAVKITANGPTRSSAVSIRIMFSNLAIFVGNTYTASIVMFFGGNQQGYFGMSILYSVITAICLVNTVLFATIADVSDYVDLKNNVSIAGMTNSITSFGMKVGVGFGSAVLGYVLNWGHYDPANIPTGMPAETLLAEKIAYIVVPGICLLVVLLIGLLIDVDKKLPELRAARSNGGN